jgi:hypothetical protein
MLLAFFRAWKCLWTYYLQQAEVGCGPRTVDFRLETQGSSRFQTTPSGGS